MLNKALESPVDTSTQRSETTTRSQSQSTDLYYDDIVYGNPSFISSPRKMGNLYTFLFFFQKQPIIAIGTNKILYVFIFQLFIHISYWFLHCKILPKMYLWAFYAITILYSVLVFSHSLLFLINPGLPPKSLHLAEFVKNDKYIRLSKEEKKEYRYCDQCHILTHLSNKIEHCDDCNICILHYDHHCFWTGKCIGKYNLWLFYPFLYGVLPYILSWFSIIFVWIKLSITNIN